MFFGPILQENAYVRDEEPGRGCGGKTRIPHRRAALDLEHDSGRDTAEGLEFRSSAACHSWSRSSSATPDHSERSRTPRIWSANELGAAMPAVGPNCDRSAQGAIGADPDRDARSGVYGTS